MADDIAKHRAAIDALDEKIAALLNERATRAAAIGKLKADGGAYRPEREAEVLRRIALANRGPLANDALARLFTEIISACRALEQPLTVAYLGPQGTFSEMALAKQFGASVAAQPCASIDEVFRAAETGTAQYAVVPVENSTDGAIGRTLDLMLTTPLQICAEVVLRVQQNLMAKRSSMKAIRKVYSHPQSLAQCHGWLSQNLPGAERIPFVEKDVISSCQKPDPFPGAGISRRRLFRQRPHLARHDHAQQARFLARADHVFLDERRQHDAPGVAARAHRAVGVLLLRRHRRPSAGSQARKSARRAARQGAVPEGLRQLSGCGSLGLLHGSM